MRSPSLVTHNLAGLLLLLSLCATARAEDKAKAKEAFRLATQHYYLGEYREALQSFKEAYRAFEDPVLLFDIAQSYRQLLNDQLALREYNMYLTVAPNAPNRDEVRALIEKLERSIAEEQATKTSPPQRTSPPSADTVARAPALAGRLDDAKYPSLVKSWEKLQDTKRHIRLAEETHAKHGTLGGHGAKAMQAVAAAEAEIDQAVMFADSHRKSGQPGSVTPEPPLTARPDDSKYTSLGDAHLDIEWAIRHIRETIQFQAPIGTLGGHGGKAEQHLRRAQAEIVEAEHWVDAHN
jgi:tetratricopeptide (TPR) repeat protein